MMVYGYLWVASMAAGGASQPDRTSEDATSVSGGSLSTGVYAGRQDAQDAVAVAPVLHGWLRPRPQAELGFSLGTVTFAAARKSGERVRTTALSNVMLGAHWVADEGRTNGRLGFEFALPLSGASYKQREALSYGLATQGGFDRWRWSASTMGAVVPFAWDSHLARVTVGVDGAVAGLFAAGGNPVDPSVAAQLRPRVSVHWGKTVLGAAVGGAYTSDRPLDRGGLLVSGQPFVERALCRRAKALECPVALRGAIVANVTRSGATEFAPSRLWAAQLSLLWRARDRDY